MKLLKHVKLFGEHTGSIEEATLQDLRQAAKEFGCVVVPMEPTEAMLDASWRQAGESVEMRRRYIYRIAQHYKLMLEAAEAAE